MNPAERIKIELRLDNMMEYMDLPDRRTAAEELLRHHNAFPPSIIFLVEEYLRELEATNAQLGR